MCTGDCAIDLAICNLEHGQDSASFKFINLRNPIIKMAEYKAKCITGKKYLQLISDITECIGKDIPVSECPNSIGDVYLSLPDELSPKIETLKKKWYIERV